jgi:hypothetical protein
LNDQPLDIARLYLTLPIQPTTVPWCESTTIEHLTEQLTNEAWSLYLGTVDFPGTSLHPPRARDKIATAFSSRDGQ